MQTISWDPTMSTGIDTLDNQHKQLISWLNDLLESVLDRLGAYAVMHFDHEEDCMNRYRCPVAAQNEAAHKDFVATFTALREDFEREGATAHLVIRVENELMRWLTNHIMATDTKLLPYVKKQAT